VRRLSEQYRFSQRHACELVNIPRSTCRYQSRRDDGELRQKLIELSHEQPRYGYRRLCVLLRRDGMRVNTKRVRRVYRAAGLQVRRIRRRRLTRSVAPRATLTGSNQEWALDFASDVTASGRRLRVLSVIDPYTRECLALETDTSFPSRRVTRVLEAVMAQRGSPQGVRSDNGPELTSRHYLSWFAEQKISTIHIQPGRPMQNGHVESFHGKLRDECLNANWFWNLWDARRKISSWRDHYNTLRPHSALGYRTPQEFAALRAADHYSAGPGEGISNADPFPQAPIPAHTEKAGMAM
jgi:putative transposase